MRLFVGLPIPDEVAEKMAVMIERLRTAGAELPWSPRGNLHVTTKFIGSWPDARLDEISSALAGIEAPALELALTGLGWFPNPHAPRIFWAGVKGGEALSRLAAATDEATAALGVARETKPYTPHVTLARIKPGMDFKALRAAVAELQLPVFGSWRAAGFHLYRSDTLPSGSVYTKLAEFRLG